MAIKSGVIGYPIKHSLSPIIHNYWLEKYGIDGEYRAYEIKPEKLEEFIKNMAEEGFAGCNVTIPHKEKVFELVEDLSDSAEKIGAVNTIIIEDGKIGGENTDWIGFLENICQEEFEMQKAVILGAGGAARGIIHALIYLNFEKIYILNRTKERAEEIKNDFSIKGKEKIKVVDWQDRSEILKDTNLLVNTTSCGMVGKPELDIDLAALPKHALVTDIVYNPLITQLLAQAQARGNPTIDGLGMLLHQAAPGFKAWFDADDKIFGENGLPEVTQELRNKVLESLK